MQAINWVGARPSGLLCLPQTSGIRVFIIIVAIAGFDSLSNGMSLMDVTYKVLLHWKRLYKGDKEQQVEQLVLALKEMNRFDVAAVMMDRCRQGVELSSDCFKY
jgi:hypothetical protein